MTSSSYQDWTHEVINTHLRVSSIVPTRKVDKIFEVLETTVDKFYNKIEKARAKRPEEEW